MQSCKLILASAVTGLGLFAVGGTPNGVALADPAPVVAHGLDDEHRVIEENSRRIAAQVQARFPIKFDQTERANVGGRKRSFLAGAQGQISKSGRVDLVHVVESKEALAGYTGYALIRFKDHEGNVVWSFAPRARGVNGTAIPGGAPSRRSDPYTFTLDPAVLLHVHSVEVVPLGAPQDTAALLTANLEKARKFVEDNKGSWELVAKLIAAGS